MIKDKHIYNIRSIMQRRDITIQEIKDFNPPDKKFSGMICILSWMKKVGISLQEIKDFDISCRCYSCATDLKRKNHLQLSSAIMCPECYENATDDFRASLTKCIAMTYEDVPKWWKWIKKNNINGFEMRYD